MDPDDADMQNSGAGLPAGPGPIAAPPEEPRPLPELLQGLFSSSDESSDESSSDEEGARMPPAMLRRSNRVQGATADNCAICLDSLSNSPDLLVQLGCNHIFHKICIEEWQKNFIANFPTCPVCRGKNIKLGTDKIYRNRKLRF